MWPWTPQRTIEALQAQPFVPLTDSKNCDQILGVCTDSRKIFKGALFAAIKGDNHDGHDHILSAFDLGAAFCLCHKDWPGLKNLSSELATRCFVTENVTLSLRHLAKSMRETFTFPVIGIGGSNGKTTTKELLKSLLSRSHKGTVVATEKSENGFLGTALTLTKPHFKVTNPPAFLVLEIGIDETDAMQQHVAMSRPDVVLLTALGPEHLAGLGTWQNAVEEELKLFRLLNKASRVWQGSEPALSELVDAEFRGGDSVTYNETDQLKIEKLESAKVSVNWKILESHKNSTKIATTIISHSESNKGHETHIFEVPLPGIHNAQNFALALTTALHLGLSVEEVLAGLAHFTPPSLRSNVESFPQGRYLYEDCYNSSPSSLQAALMVMKQSEWQQLNKIFILGDMLDLGDSSKTWHDHIPGQLEGFLQLRLCLVGQAMYAVYKTLITSNHWHEDPTVTSGRFVCWFDCVAAVKLQTFVPHRPNPDTVVLVKGSRGIGLDALSGLIRQWLI